MEELGKWRNWGNGGIREMEDLGNGRPGKCRTWELEDPEKWRVQENGEYEEINKNVDYVLLTLFFLLQLFGDSWISRVVAGALTVFSTALITRYPYGRIYI